MVTPHRQSISRLSDGGDLGEPLVPINNDARNHRDRCFSFELETGPASVASSFKPVESQRAINGIYEPDFADAGTLVNREFNALVMVGSTR